MGNQMSELYFRTTISNFNPQLADSYQYERREGLLIKSGHWLLTQDYQMQGKKLAAVHLQGIPETVK
jgi:hypothetical protein